MLTIKDMNNRIAYLKKVIPMYQEELTGLEMLTNVYSNPEYASLKALEQEEQPQSKAEPKPKPKPKKDTRTEGMYSTRKFFEVIKQRPMLKEEILRATIKTVNLSTDHINAKRLGLSTNTLAKLLRTAVYKGWLEKVDRAVYIVPKDQVDYIRQHLPV